MKANLTLITTYFLLLVSPIGSFGQYNVQNFGVAQGLAQIQVGCLAEDSLGYLWVGTAAGGLSRFDGLTFKNYTINEGLPNNSIRDLLVMKNGLWIATQNGVSRFSNNQFINYQIPGSPDMFVKSIFNHYDSIFFLKYEGEIGMILNDSVYNAIKHPLFKTIIKVFKTKGMTLVIQQPSTALELVLINKSEQYKLRIDNQFTEVFSTFNYDNGLALSTDGGLYLVKNKLLVKLLDVHFPLYEFDHLNKSFLALKANRLVNIQLNGKQINEGFPFNFFTYTKLIDSEGNYWFGTERGLFKVYPYIFEKLLTDRTENEPVMAISQNEKELLIGTFNQGVKIYKDLELIRKSNFNSKLRNTVFTIIPDGVSKFFIGTYGGLAIYENSNFTWLPSSTIESVLSGGIDKDNNAYFGSASRGLYKYSSNGQVTKIQEFSNLLAYSVSYNKWNDYFAIGTGNGLWKIQSDSVLKMPVAELDGVELSCLEWLASNTLVIGTLGRGLFIHSSTNNTLLKLDQANGLCSNTVFFAAKDEGGFWVGTERGIDFVEFQISDYLLTNITHYDEKDGLIGLETNKDAHFKTDDGLLFGLNDGLYRLKEKNRIVIDNPLHVDEIKLFFDGHSSSSVNYINGSNYQNKGYSFSSIENHLTFGFNKVNKRDPDDYYYSYKLEGHDQIWSAPSQVKSVTYSNISPGTYSFQLKATDKSGRFSHDRTQFNFSIMPAFYQTLWFKSIIVSLVIVFIMLVISWYNKNKLRRILRLQDIKDTEQARLRKDIARDFHDELGNQSARMINYVGLLKIKQKIEADTYEALHSYAHQILTGTKDFVWALDPNNDELNNLSLHLKDFAERMFQEKDINFGFFGDLPTHCKLPTGYSRQINLIFKEAMTNAFKHSHASSVSLHLNMQNEIITFSLGDNGHGLPTGTWENALRGIDNMKIRANRIGAELSYTSNHKGTKIILEFGIPRNTTT